MPNELVANLHACTVHVGNSCSTSTPEQLLLAALKFTLAMSAALRGQAVGVLAAAAMVDAAASVALAVSVVLSAVALVVGCCVLDVVWAKTKLLHSSKAKVRTAV